MRNQDDSFRKQQDDLTNSCAELKVRVLTVIRFRSFTEGLEMISKIYINDFLVPPGIASLSRDLYRSLSLVPPNILI